MRASLFACSAIASVVVAQQPAWAQCGGQGYTGDTSCISGYTCVTLNAWYSQCQVSSATTSLVTVTKTTATATATSSSGATIKDVQFLGRVNPATKELSWSGTGIAFTFKGTSASIGLSSLWGTNSADLVVDDGEPIVIADVSGSSISTPAGLSSGTHTVVLRKRSEAQMGSIYIGDVTTNGVAGTYAAPTRRIEIIGDSISVGYGLDGTLPCTNNASVEDAPKTYGALAAEALDADYSIIAWSGKGLVRNIATGSVDTSPLMPELWTRYGGNDADNSYTFPSGSVPDAVVINLGTNDFSYLSARDPIDASVYEAGLVDFVQTIQEHYPKAEFFLLNSPMLSDTWPTAEDAQKTTQTNAIEAAIAELNDTKVHFVDWPTQGSDVGCDYHPNAATHAAEATVLADAISAALGW
ncbi:SGNH hydrolase-type esterase domain-containing protein [Truncatella angustata]|uniref:SGNH hydrolase-type esterase domain-containing protein n=1 Tax=Truncatella angustata TaxID=152316 RepID=A0A9P8ZTP5_9PEZI|nr:SGNH hydrolase-type esterase domain-containing protein [Truncatella angustata]KAH6649085.1 SGNH hydrolase-type esterase domain-containing protein [Truncatella angustata]KAH8197915.1 hypothetical protein TruAng_007918 [Truncatella angustata]